MHICMNAGEVRGKLMMWGWKGETDQLSACWKSKKTGGNIFYAKWPKSRLEPIRRGPTRHLRVLHRTLGKRLEPEERANKGWSLCCWLGIAVISVEVMIHQRRG